MVVRSRHKEDNDYSSMIDDLIETSFLESGYETLDSETLKLIEDYEMTATMNSITTQPKLGQLNIGQDCFNASFTPEGSSAIERMTYNDEILTVTFRRSPGTQYEYIIPSMRTLSNIMEEVQATLVEGEGSVGRMIQSLIRNNEIQLR